MTDFEKIKYYYDKGYWNKEQVAMAVNCNKVSVQEYYEITNDTGFLLILVDEGKLTQEEYEEVVNSQSESNTQG